MSALLSWALIVLVASLLIGGALTLGGLFSSASRALLNAGQSTARTPTVIEQALAEQHAFEQEQALLERQHQQELAAIRRLGSMP